MHGEADYFLRLLSLGESCSVSDTFKYDYNLMVHAALIILIKNHYDILSVCVSERVQPELP